jgi:hypothetical protein
VILRFYNERLLLYQTAIAAKTEVYLFCIKQSRWNMRTHHNVYIIIIIIIIIKANIPKNAKDDSKEYTVSLFESTTKCDSFQSN